MSERLELNPDAVAFEPMGGKSRDPAYVNDFQDSRYRGYDRFENPRFDDFNRRGYQYYERSRYGGDPYYDERSRYRDTDSRQENQFPTRQELYEHYKELQMNASQRYDDNDSKYHGVHTPSRSNEREELEQTQRSNQAGARSMRVNNQSDHAESSQNSNEITLAEINNSVEILSNITPPHSRTIEPMKIVPSTPPQMTVRTPPSRGLSLEAKEASYDADCIVNLIRSQLEFYFSDKNLCEETNSNLIFYMMQDRMWVPLHVVCSLPKIRSIGGQHEDVLTALRTSTLLELNENEAKVRRPGYKFPVDFKIRKSLRRSVLVYGLSPQMTDKDVRQLLEMHGNILCVSFVGSSDGPDPEMARVIMKKKLGDPSNLMELTSAFVIFESQSQANKCVKARSRSSNDGIRTMHKYDYNKVVKRLGKGMSPNASPLFTPTQSPSFTSASDRGSPSSYSLSGQTPTFSAGNPQNLKLSPVLSAHRSPKFQSRSMSRSPVIRSMNSRSPFHRSQRSPHHSPSWKLEEGANLRARSSSMQNRRVIVAKGPDNTKGFRWHRNPKWRANRTALDVLGTM